MGSLELCLHPACLGEFKFNLDGLGGPETRCGDDFRRAVLKEEQVCRSWWVYIPMRGVECGSGASLEGRGFGISVLYVKLWRIRGEDGKGI